LIYFFISNTTQNDGINKQETLFGIAAYIYNYAGG